MKGVLGMFDWFFYCPLCFVSFWFLVYIYGFLEVLFSYVYFILVFACRIYDRFRWDGVLRCFYL